LQMPASKQRIVIVIVIVIVIAFACTSDPLS
jgi:hypothetical protein